jgi:hypothetical protein
MFNMLSKNPKLSVEKMLVFGALGLYVYKYVMLKKQGQLSGDPELAVKIDKQKMFDMAEKQFKLNPFMRQAMEGLYDTMMAEKEEV